MKAQITFEIECGKERCAVEAGKFCRFYKWSLNGNARCYLFGELLDDDERWSLRHPKCKVMAQELENK